MGTDTANAAADLPPFAASVICGQNIMKIFSLQSKTSLVAWSVALGFFINLVVFMKSKFVHIPEGGCLYWPEMRFSCTDFFADYGSPIHFQTKMQGDQLTLVTAFLYNCLFWILVVLIILSLVRYFRKPKV